jgi:hypothetical protein
VSQFEIFAAVRGGKLRASRFAKRGPASEAVVLKAAPPTRYVPFQDVAGRVDVAVDLDLAMRASFWTRTDRPLACRSGSMLRPASGRCRASYSSCPRVPSKTRASSINRIADHWLEPNQPPTHRLKREKAGLAALGTTGNTRAIFALPLWTTGVTGTTERALLRSSRGRRLMLSSCGDGRPSRRFGQQIATDPISSGTRVGHGREIGPRFAGPEIARQCGAAVRQERPSGQPGGLFLSARFPYRSLLPARNCDRATRGLMGLCLS